MFHPHLEKGTLIPCSKRVFQIPSSTEGPTPRLPAKKTKRGRSEISRRRVLGASCAFERDISCFVWVEVAFWRTAWNVSEERVTADRCVSVAEVERAHRPDRHRGLVLLVFFQRLKSQSLK